MQLAMQLAMQLGVAALVAVVVVVVLRIKKEGLKDTWCDSTCKKCRACEKKPGSNAKNGCTVCAACRACTKEKLKANAKPNAKPKPRPEPKPNAKPNANAQRVKLRSIGKTYAPDELDLRSPSGKRGAIGPWQGKTALKATYRARARGPGASDLDVTLAPAGFVPATQLRVGFKWWVDADFPWGRDVREAAGKILGLQIGTGSASGGDYSSTGASVRVVWHRNGGVAPYVYPQGGPGDQDAGVRAVTDVEKGMHLFNPDDKDDASQWPLRLVTNAWNDIELFCKLNTPGKRDGVVELAVNGTRKRLDNFRYLVGSARGRNATINGVHIQTFFGGGDNSYAPPRKTHSWFADFWFKAS